MHKIRGQLSQDSYLKDNKLVYKNFEKFSRQGSEIVQAISYSNKRGMG